MHRLDQTHVHIDVVPLESRFGRQAFKHRLLDQQLRRLDRQPRQHHATETAQIHAAVDQNRLIRWDSNLIDGRDRFDQQHITRL